jgi:hypothetical protein
VRCEKVRGWCQSARRWLRVHGYILSGVRVENRIPVFLSSPERGGACGIGFLIAPARVVCRGVWQSSASYPQDVDVKDNVNNVITIREADWPMLWRMSNASLNYLHGSALTCPLPKSALPPAPNPTGENSFDRSVTVNNAAADATSRQLPPFKVSLAKPDLPVMQGAVDSEVRPAL